eukprot:TRINITY_DN198_c0_g1_i5.p1 TRINITY_DN198_c0_g1~~TRINITY_DN198_c0_g1_i5.p1  ORF type:complete len:102 (-),score=7.13 TRINITY_DN198_c0_g1_i5:54-359(-)
MATSGGGLVVVTCEGLRVTAAHCRHVDRLLAPHVVRLHVELDVLLLRQRAEPLHADGALVHEHLTIVVRALDEPEPLLVEPAHNTALVRPQQAARQADGHL